MKRNFFKMMLAVEKDKNTNLLSSQSVVLFNRLVDAVESGGFSDSEATKFICKNGLIIVQ